jgi:UDP-N-acetyl-2-amino-2-deoxyglucuronate dehydrogenase
MSKIRFAVVGLGNIGTRHVQHIMQNEQAELVAVCDNDTSKSNSQTAPFYSDLSTLLQEQNIDVLNVCTPNYLHSAHTIQALNAGVHVVCEKPMAISTTECEAMNTAAAKSGKHIFVVKQNRYNPPVQEVKKLLEQGALGKIVMVQVNCFWNRNEHYYAQSDWRGKKKLDGGCLFTQFSHFVDILFYLFGHCAPIYSVMKNELHAYTEVEDSGVCVLQTNSGALVNFNFSTNAYQKNMEGAISILGEYGTVKIGGQYLNTIEYQHIKNIALPEINITAKSNNYGLYQGSMSNHDKVIKNVVDTLNGLDTVMTNAQEGTSVVTMIEGMYAQKNAQR